MKPLAGSRLKIIGIVTVLLLFVSIPIIASPCSKGNHQYKCKSCGTSGNNDTQTQQSEPVIEKLEGQEKDNSVSRALDSEDFKLVNSILTKAGYRPVLGNSCVLRMKKSLRDTSVEYLVVGIDYAGDRESRPVAVLVFMEPYGEAYGFRLNYKRNLLELLVKASNGKTSGLLLNDYSVDTINSIPPIITQNCNPCEIPVFTCTSWSITCLLSCCVPCVFSSNIPWFLVYVFAWCPCVLVGVV